jgi:two-component system, OmpR family, phosphate regulon sensor histidine kinase PhoR
MFRNSIFKKLFFAYLLLITLFLGILSLINIEILHNSYLNEINQQLENTLQLVKIIIKDTALNNPQLSNQIKEVGKNLQTRITIINPDGTVMIDSEHDPATMANHNTRPEILKARATGIGQDVHLSETLSVDMLYLARPLEPPKLNDEIIRVALPLSYIARTTHHMYYTVGITFIGLIIIALIIGLWLVRRVSQPIHQMVQSAEAIAQGQFDKPIPITSNDEMSRLAQTINQMSLELKQRFIEINQEKTTALKYEQMRRDFVANVSHELRTPLTFIKGYTETLKELLKPEQKQAQEFMEIIEKNIGQLTHLVEDLLDLSRLESHQGITRISPTNPANLLNQVIDTFQPAIALKQHTITKDIPVNLPELLIDSDLMGKALANLLDNAIKYTPDKGQITIKATAEPTTVRISVIDNGIGIPQDDIPRIFERFYRVDKSRSREMGGTGLGLAIVKHIVQLHHGEVSVQSKPGAGSTFTITLPR